MRVVEVFTTILFWGKILLDPPLFFLIWNPVVFFTIKFVLSWLLLSQTSHERTAITYDLVGAFPWGFSLSQKSKKRLRYSRLLPQFPRSIQPRTSLKRSLTLGVGINGEWSKLSVSHYERILRSVIVGEITSLRFGGQDLRQGFRWFEGWHSFQSFFLGPVAERWPVSL